MISNTPDFDPLNCTAEEDADMMAGYRSFPGTPRPDASLAYAHGRRSRMHDEAGVSEPDQRELARRLLDSQKEAGPSD